MLHASIAAQIQCIAKPGFYVANCDAIPGKLCAVMKYVYIYEVVWLMTWHVF